MAIIQPGQQSSGGGGSQTLAQTLALGNSAGSKTINMNSNKITSGAAASASTDIPIFSQVPTLLAPTAVKTANYNAAAGDLIPCDISAGAFTVTLPTAPADKTQVCVEIVARVTTGAPFYVTVATGGSDVLFKASGPTSGIQGRGSVVFQYNASGAIWYAPGTGDLLPTNWEFGYDALTNEVDVTSTSEAAPTTIIACAAHVFDGQPVMARFFSPYVVSPADVNPAVSLSLWKGATELGFFNYTLLAIAATTDQTTVSITADIRFTPPAGSNTYLVTGYTSNNTGSPRVGAGAGGVSASMPAFIRFTKV